MQDMNTKPHKRPLLPKLVLIGLAAAAGVWLVSRFSSAESTLLSEVQKLTAVIRLIQTQYVEEPNLETLTQGAIEGMLKRLDPHSVYIAPEEQKEFAERDRGEFEGIGISFTIQNELITVIAPITGTPAERVGVRSGDKIIEIDSVSAYGISNEEVFKKLRGPRGTTVRIKVVREGVPEPIDFALVRDKIPINSVWSSFMLDDSTGYILLNQFTSTTSSEVAAALNQLEAKGMTRLVFDLRNNQGGRLNEAVEIADMFLPEGQVIVSRRGRNPAEDSTYYSTKSATHPMFSLVVLINGGSASASEIVAGAVQDLDRGLLVGANSFGKGLVQYPYQLRDGGVIRLSVAHYYTPSGRLIQRSYDEGAGEYYASRAKDPEAMQNNKERKEFFTLSGRKVYSGSGIAPDITVEEGTITAATARVISARLPFEFAEILVREKGFGGWMKTAEFINGFNLGDDDFRRLQTLAKSKDIVLPDEAIARDRDYLNTLVKSEMAQIIWNDRDHYYIVRTATDPVVMKAMESFGQAREIAAAWLKGRKG